MARVRELGACLGGDRLRAGLAPRPIVQWRWRITPRPIAQTFTRLKGETHGDFGRALMDEARALHGELEVEVFEVHEPAGFDRMRFKLAREDAR